MDANANQSDVGSKQSQLTALVERVLHHPTQLRVLLMVVVIGVWYAGFSVPLTAGIDQSLQRAERERKRLALAVEVERLRAQVDRFQGRLPQKTDPNEWVQYMMEGVRRFPLRQVMLDTDGTKDIGPYKAIVIKLQVEGTFHDVDAFLRWIEGNTRLLRVDLLRLEPSRIARNKLDVQMVVLGVMG